MPVSKRDKLVSLSKSIKKGRKAKEKLVGVIHECVEQYETIFVFSFSNMRTSLLKQVRSEWKEGRFFLGKNKVMQVALGSSFDAEFRPNLHKLSECLVGHCGLFFTSQPKEDVFKFFDDYKEYDYARSGFVATRTIVLDEGPTLLFQAGMDSYLRQQLEMPVSLKKGVVHLDSQYTVCTLGKPLSSHQAAILKLMDIKMSEFHFTIRGVWSGGEFRDIL